MRRRGNFDEIIFSEIDVLSRNFYSETTMSIRNGREADSTVYT